MMYSNNISFTYLNAFSCGALDDIRYIQHNGCTIPLTPNGDTLFIPTYCMPFLDRIIGHAEGSVIVPLPKALHKGICKSPRTIINKLFYRHYNGFNESLLRVDTEKGYGYYGGRGIILTENYEPLMICGFEVRIGVGDSVYGYNYVDAICHISPEVFTNTDMMSKFIVKHLIPFYGTCYTEAQVDGKNLYVRSGKVRVIISDDIRRMIYRPVEMSGTESDTGIYDVLSNNIHVFGL